VSTFSSYLKNFQRICLTSISVQKLRRHVSEPDPAAIWIHGRFILLGISQYSLLSFYIYNSLVAFVGSLALRLMALAVFLFVAFKTFYSSMKGPDG
jgi:hypothetical protein